ncbi:hypothetical protein GH153_03475, partial [bacterium]|nr:hypothetical protein [bacterium]
MNRAPWVIFGIASSLVGLMLIVGIITTTGALMSEPRFEIHHFFILFFSLVLIATGL